MWPQPPENVPPEQLFRLLLKTPRPTYRVGLASIAGVVGAFSAIGLSSGEVADAISDVQENDDKDTETYERFGRITALSLLCDGERVFNSLDELGLLHDREATAVVAATMAALRVVSPTYAYSDTDAWMSVLVKGAKHPTNYQQARAIADTRDVVSGFRKPLWLPHPDRFFGLPVGQLIDGQLMAYRAAVKMIDPW